MTPPASSPRRRHGALRDEVLALLLHAEGPLTARRITDTLAGADGGTPVLTTVLTVLDRLHRAGEVDKARAETGELLFSVARHDAGVAAGDMLEALMRSDDRTGALLSFAGNLNAEDLAVLRGLVDDPDRPTEPDQPHDQPHDR